MATNISLAEIQQSFVAFAEANGTISDVAFADEELVMARCVLPMKIEVQPGDTFKGGVAIQATVEEIEVRPYLLRLVCTNGAIMMQSNAGSKIATSVCSDVWLREAFATASSQEAFASAAAPIASLAEGSFDRGFLLVSMMQHFRGFDKEIVREMIRRMVTDGTSGYSLFNAITSVARDTGDARTRWRLEAAGGGLPALLLTGPAPRAGFDALRLPTEVSEFDRELQNA